MNHYRYDYENCDASPCNQMIAELESACASQKLNKQSFSAEGKTYTVAKADNFEYIDPVDKSVASKQVSLNCIPTCKADGYVISCGFLR